MFTDRATSDVGQIPANTIAGGMVQSWGVIGLGLSAFALSTFIPTFRFGALMIGLLTVGLIGNLFFLPALLAGPLGRLIARHIRRQPLPETPAREHSHAL